MISHVLFLHLFIYSKTNEWMHLFLERLKEILPSPFLEPVVSFYERAGDDLKFHIQLKAPGKNELAYFSTQLSSCGKYCVSASQRDVLVFCLKRTNRLSCLKGHEKNVSEVKLNSDASMVISGSFDSSIIVWYD